MTVRQPKPPWLRRKIPAPGRSGRISEMLADLSLFTVCQEAMCPNQGECFGRGTATFLLLGPNCTRNCTFCAVEKHPPALVDPLEPARVAEAVRRMGLTFCVLTMVTRDDLEDGGASQVASTIEAIRQTCPGVGIEVLISDLKGNEKALSKVLAARPEVLNHNVETVPRLYPEIRPRAVFERSLAVIAASALSTPRPVVKSGLMVGLGETFDEIVLVLKTLARAGCDALTIGQYLAPSIRHHPVVRFVPPEEFDRLAEAALEAGFKAVASGPYVRSSYQAREMFGRVLADEA